MSNLFSRMIDSVAADLNKLLDQKEEKNPTALLNQYVRESERETEKVRILLERQYRLQEEFTKELKEAKELAEKRGYQVEIASKAGEVELYDFALAEKDAYEARAARLELALENAAKQLSELEKKHNEMKHRLKDMHLKRLEIMGRENIANANKRISYVLKADENPEKPFERFEQMESYINRIEEKVNANYHRNTIDARIAELEKQLKKDESDLIS